MISLQKQKSLDIHQTLIFYGCDVHYRSERINIRNHFSKGLIVGSQEYLVFKYSGTLAPQPEAKGSEQSSLEQSLFLTVSCEYQIGQYWAGHHCRVYLEYHTKVLCAKKQFQGNSSSIKIASHEVPQVPNTVTKETFYYYFSLAFERVWFPDFFLPVFVGSWQQLLEVSPSAAHVERCQSTSGC